jgi:hypothetical protein
MRSSNTVMLADSSGEVSKERLSVLGTAPKLAELLLMSHFSLF